MDAENPIHRRLVFHLVILHGPIPKRRSVWRPHLHLLRLRCNLGPALHRHQNQRIHPHQIVRIRAVSNRDIGSRRERQRTTLRVLRLRTVVDSEARTWDVVGGCGVGDGGGDDGCGSNNTYITKRILCKNWHHELARLYSITDSEYNYKLTNMGFF